MNPQIIRIFFWVVIALPMYVMLLSICSYIGKVVTMRMFFKNRNERDGHNGKR